MTKDNSKKTYTGSQISDRYLIHSLTGNTSGNNTADSIMNIINQKPSTSSNQTSRNTREGE